MRSQKIEVIIDSDRYVYSGSPSNNPRWMECSFFFLFKGLRGIGKELERVTVRNNHDKLETLINSDTPKEGRVKITSRRKVRHKQKPKGTPFSSRHILVHAYTHTQTRHVDVL